jgi:VWFA-related protein
MRRTVLFTVLLAPAMIVPIYSQDTQNAAPALQTLHTSTQLVVVNVAVRDRNGKPVSGLPRTAFEVREDKKLQTLRYFAEERPEPSTSHDTLGNQPAPALPPGVFTDLAPEPAKGPLNILLLDSLNTPIQDQAYLRSQLLEYVRQMKPGTSVAIFGLASRLYLLQGFSSSPEVLRNALTHSAISPSTLLPPTADSNTSATTASEAVADSAGAPPANPGSSTSTSQILDTAAVLGQFEADVEAYQTQVRIQTTVDAFNALARYLNAMPGKKNLLWFSGSFPLTLLPDPTAGSQATSTFFVNELVKNTTALLAKAQVAIYPIDARGLMVNPAFDASRSGARYGRSPTAFAQDVTRFQMSLAQEHNTELTVAEQSGGRAFFNTNSLAAAVNSAIEDGSKYYVLEYSSTNPSQDDGYRQISVTLQGAAAASGYTLEYRRGYYSANSSSVLKSEVRSGSTELTSPADVYARAAMSRGAPTPTEVLFTVSVLPASSTPEAILPEDVKKSVTSTPKPPYRRFHVTYALMPGDLHFEADQSGNHAGHLAFLAFVYDANGQLVLSNGRDLTFNLDEDKYKNFLRAPVRYSLDIDAPVGGESYLRLGVHDLEDNHFGVVEVPISSLPSSPGALP